MNPQQLQTCSDEEFLQLLAQRDIQLRLHEGKLRLSAPAGVLDDQTKSELTRRKTNLIAMFTTPQPTTAPLSYAQERLWLIERFRPGNFAYNFPEGWQINAAIDPGTMQAAINTVLRRHAALRSSFHESAPANPVQQIHDNVSSALEVLDYRQLHPAKQQEHLQQTLNALARQPFDLSLAPLVRFYLFELAREKHVFFINMHHIISDRWSMRILYRELFAAYQAHAQGREADLPPLTTQYADFVRRDRATSPAYAEHLHYWQTQLATPPDPPQLPFRLQPAVAHPFDGAIHSFSLTAQDAAGIRALARIHSASPYMVLLAAYAVLLHRYTGVTDLCVGSPVSERTTTDTESLIGLFVNTLVLRLHVPREATFAQIVRTVRETVLDAQTHQLPLQRILTDLRGLANQPLVSTLFAFDADMGKVMDATATPVAIDPGAAKFDLSLQMYEDQARIGGWFEYRTDLFTPEAIDRFSQAFALLLRDAIRSAESPVAKLTIMPAEERTRLLKTWNDTVADFPLDRTIHQLVEEQAAQTPDAIAVIDGLDRISYRDLDRRANRIAHALLARGVTLESIVGIRMPRSAGMIAAMLGILKAGAAYLPLDPQYPEQRVRFMTEDSRCAVVLSEEPGPTPGESEDHPATTVAPSNLAYVIYTSGSTGQPKGVAIEHHSAVSFLHWARNTFSAEQLRGTLASTSISFDLSVFEIFAPLISGQTVILAKDILALRSLPAAGEVTLVTTVPSAASAVLAAGGFPANVHTLNLAGEPLSTALVDRLYRETSIADVNDLYGPTETTTYSTWTRRTSGVPATIGRPIANTRVYIVDASLELVPEGVPGELLIAGEGVARGYLHRPELTAEKFVSLAHLGEPGIAYRTGDLVRYRPDGQLEYLGRLDNQVKIRGFRIELAEIEATLMTYPGVLEAVVVVDARATLIGTLVLHPGHALDTAALIDHQAQFLPGHMIVRVLHAVEDFPRTPNGKIDRRQLIASSSSQTASLPTPARDPLERELTSIWQQAFGLTSIGIDDDFFQLGGHSLLALRLFSEIESRLGRTLMLSILFEAPTIRLLAEKIRQQSPVATA